MYLILLTSMMLFLIETLRAKYPIRVFRIQAHDSALLIMLY